MAEATGERQLGDFIKGRLLFVEDYCRRSGLDPARVTEEVKAEALRLAQTPERRSFLEMRLFGGGVLSSSVLPDWLDRVFLEAMTHVLKGPGGALATRSSRRPCLASEAGRFNAHRQAETVFRILFAGKKPEDWLRLTFPGIYRKCYGDAAVAALVVEERGPGRFRVVMDNRSLDKASPLDCSTIVGYLQGSLEKLGAEDVVVEHEACSVAPGATDPRCVFAVSWGR